MRRCKGSRRHPPHGTYGSASGRQRHRYGFFSLVRRSPLENGATPEFHYTSLFSPFLFFFAVATRDRSEEISRVRLDRDDLLSPDFRLHIRYATRMPGSMRAATSVTAAVTKPKHSKPSWTNDTSRSDEFEGCRTRAAIRLGISELKTPTLFPTSTRLLIIDVAAILPCANTYTTENETTFSILWDFLTSMKLNVVSISIKFFEKI